MRQDEMADASPIVTAESKGEVGLRAFSSAALMRLIEEVRNDEAPHGRAAYDRTYHRHNR